jgi:hypothetical protein
MSELWMDMRLAVRSLRKSQAYFGLSAMTLTVAIGAGTSLFGIVKAALLDELPFGHPAQLVALHESVPSMQMSAVPLSTNGFLSLRSRAKSFADMGAYETVSGELSSVSPALNVGVAKVTAGLLDTQRRASGPAGGVAQRVTRLGLSWTRNSARYFRSGISK